MPTRKKAKKISSKKNAWFYAVRGSYLPNSGNGWLTYIPYVAVLIGSMQWAKHQGGSLTDIFFKVFPVWVAAAVVMHYVAKQHS